MFVKGIYGFTVQCKLCVISGIIESDDIAMVNLEIEKALNFSKKSAMLVDSVKTKYGEVSSWDLDSLFWTFSHYGPKINLGERKHCQILNFSI